MALHARYLVVGLGAVGSIIAVALSHATNGDVVAVTRSSRACGSRLVAVKGFGEATIYTCGWSGAEKHGLSADIILVATKAYDVASVVSLLKHSRVEADLYVSLQNGLGSLELLEEVYGGDRVAAGVVYFGATRHGDSVEFKGLAEGILLGCRNPPCKPLLRVLEEDLRRGGLEARVVDWIEPYRWLKLAINAAVNPLTAIAARENGFILENHNALQLAETIVLEVVRVAEKLKITLSEDPLQALYTVLDKTRHNKSSMLQDIMECRPTEVDYINGAVVLKAREVGVEATANKVLWLLVKAIEATRCPEKRR